jgi:hypothetical protein
VFVVVDVLFACTEEELLSATVEEELDVDGEASVVDT